MYIYSLEANKKTNIKDEKLLSKKGKNKYQCLVGNLIYLTLNRSYINYITNVVSQFMHALTDVHVMVAQRILCFLKDIGKGLSYTKQTNIKIEGYVDANWASSVYSRWSTRGYCLYLDDNLVDE